jgi:hypothetical protein
MGLNVQWRWSMPQVGNPDQVAQGNRDAFSEGIGAIAQGLLKRGENQREAKRLAQTQANWDAQFAAQQEQRKIANAMQEQQFNEQKRMNDQSLLNQQRQLQKDQEQRQWLQKFYDQFFGDDEEYKELQELRKKFGGNGNAALVMMGLNPALR